MAFSIKSLSINATILAMSNPYPNIPMGPPRSTLNVNPATDVAAIPANIVSALTKNGRQLSVSVAFINSIHKSLTSRALLTKTYLY